MMRKRNKKGQSILEYVIVLTAVVGAIAAGVAAFIYNPVAEGDPKSGLANVYTNAATRMSSSTARLGSELFE
ncbi:MAG: hypothetical protein P9L96_02500 [Candidatus Gygaella obscura]|nr:hypothetical protein [Candidatus Gygaella obscura]